MENNTETNFATIDDLKKLIIKIGTIISAERVEGSDKLLKIILDFGEESPRQILSGIAKWYAPEDLIGKQVQAVINLQPRKMMGLESQGMILMADDVENDSVSLMHPNKLVPNGSLVL